MTPAPGELSPAGQAGGQRVGQGGAAQAAGQGTFEPAPVESPSWGATQSSRSGAMPTVVAGRDVTGATPFVPRRLVLPSGRSAPVLPADTGTDGALVIPENPAQVGWWTGGARAGDPYGSMVLAGHIDSRRYGIGVLAELATARPGQVVQLAADPLVRRYTIESVRRVVKARLAADAAVFSQSGQPRLVLVTCGGPFDAATHAYEDNVVITATPTA